MAKLYLASMQEFFRLQACIIREMTNTGPALCAVQLDIKHTKWPVKSLVFLLFVVSTSRKTNLPFGQPCYIKPALYPLALTREAFCGCVPETHLSARTDVHFVGGVKFKLFLLRQCRHPPGLKSINLVRYRGGVRPLTHPSLAEFCLCIYSFDRHGAWKGAFQISSSEVISGFPVCELCKRGKQKKTNKQKTHQSEKVRRTDSIY